MMVNVEGYWLCLGVAGGVGKDLLLDLGRSCFPPNGQIFCLLEKKILDYDSTQRETLKNPENISAKGMGM